METKESISLYIIIDEQN